MTVVEDLRNDMPIRDIARISGIPFSSFYDQEKERGVRRLPPNRRSDRQDCVRKAHLRLQESLDRDEERQNESQQKGSEESADNQQSLTAICQAQGQNKTQESVPSHRA